MAKRDFKDKFYDCLDKEFWKRFKRSYHPNRDDLIPLEVCPYRASLWRGYGNRLRLPPRIGSRFRCPLCDYSHLIRPGETPPPPPLGYIWGLEIDGICWKPIPDYEYYS